MYLLDSQAFSDLVSRDEERSIFKWLKATMPGQQQLFVSAVSIGMVANHIEDKPKTERGAWRRSLDEARHTFVSLGNAIAVELPTIDIWAADLRGLELFESDGKTALGEDERLVIATAIARKLTLVAAPQGYLDVICASTTLTVLHP